MGNRDLSYDTNMYPNRLREHRLKAGLTQKQVAEKLGLKCEDRLSHWERGQAMPSVRNLFKLCEIYKIDVIRHQKLSEGFYPTWYQYLFP